MSPKDIHALVSGNCDYDAFHGKQEFAEVTKVEMENVFSGFSGWTQSKSL